MMAAALPAISMGMTAVGGIMNYMGAKAQGQAQANMYQYQAAVAQQNAVIAQRNEQTALGVGEEKAMIEGQQGRQRMGAVRAGQAASGVDIGSGSALDVQAGQAYADRKTQEITRDTAGRQATDYATQAYGDLAQAGLDEQAAKTSIQAGDIKAMGSLIGGAGSVADKWMNLNKLGAFTDPTA